MCCPRQHSCNSLAAEGGFNVKIFIYTRIRAGKSRIVCSDAAHAHGTIAALGHEECNSPLSDGPLKLFLLEFYKCFLADFALEAVFQLQKLPIGGIVQKFHGEWHCLCGRKEHQRLAPFVNAVFNESNASPEPETAFVSAVIQFSVACAARLCPVQKNSSACSACSIASEFRVDAEFHDKALSILGSENHRQCKANVLSVPLKEQIIAVVLRPVVNVFNLRTVFRIVLPAAGPGILSGVILGIGRIVGETAALIFTAGTMAQIPGLFQSGRTLAIHMYVLSGEALHMNEANATAVVLLLVVLLMNTLSALAAKKLTKK